MKPDVLKTESILDSMMVAVIPIAIIYWIIDSILNIFFSDKYNIFAEIFGPELYEIYTRLIVLCILLIFGAHAQSSINKLTKTRDALRESEEDHRTFIENLSAGVYRTCIDSKGQFVRANKAIAKIFGYRSIEDFMKIKFSDLFSNPHDREAFNIEIMEKGYVSGYELHLKKRDGTTIWVSCSAAIRSDENGEIKWIDGVIEDITARKKAEEALRLSEERYRQLVKYAPAGICEIDLRTQKFLRVNDVMCELTGYSQDEILSMKFYEILTENNKGLILKRLKKLFNAEKGNESTELKMRDKFGKPIWVAINSRYHYASDRLKSATVVVHDISKIKRTELEKRRLQNQLQRAQKIEAIGTLAGGIAHDFNNLLMAIQGHISLMLAKTDYLHPYFNNLLAMEDRIKSAKDLTSKLLGFAKGGNIQKRATILNDLVQEQIRIFEQTSKDIRIHKKYNKDIWSVEADPVQINQVLMNVLVNALQAMPNGGDIHIQTQNVILDQNVSKKFQAEPGKYVKLLITDTGIGMNKKTIRRVFEPFFTTKTLGPQKGSGLGLASAYGIIKNHGGFITVKSKQGTGSSFSIFLPAAKKRDDVERKNLKDIEKRKETILAIDNDSEVLDIFKQMLNKLGYHVLIASDVNQAVEIFDQNSDKIDLVIVDLNISPIKSDDIFVKLKMINPEVKILISSDESFEEAQKMLINQDVRGFLQKPFSVMQLSDKLSSITP